jgi:hypothetical protein
MIELAYGHDLMSGFAFAVRLFSYAFVPSASVL